MASRERISFGDQPVDPLKDRPVNLPVNHPVDHPEDQLERPVNQPVDPPEDQQRLKASILSTNDPHKSKYLTKQV